MDPIARGAIDLATRGIIAISAVLLLFGAGAAVSDSYGLRVGRLEEFFLIASFYSSFLLIAFVLLPRRYLGRNPIKFSFLATVVIAEVFFIRPIYRNRELLIRYFEAAIDGRPLPEKSSPAHHGVLHASLLLILLLSLGISAAWQLRQPRN